MKMSNRNVTRLLSQPNAEQSQMCRSTCYLYIVITILFAFASVIVVLASRKRLESRNKEIPIVLS